MMTVLGILAALAFGFLAGRIWQIRFDELERRAGLAAPPVARISQPRDAGTQPRGASLNTTRRKAITAS
jgi:hypothetical protein